TRISQRTSNENALSPPSRNALAVSNERPVLEARPFALPPYDQPSPRGFASCRYALGSASTVSLPHAPIALIMCPSAPGSNLSAYFRSPDTAATNRASAFE